MANYESLEFDRVIRRELIKEGKYKGDAKRALDEIIKKHKRKYRDQLKHELAGTFLYLGYGKIVSYGGSYDSLWKKVFFLGEHWTDEEKREFVRENWRKCKPSQYDCTGQIFTLAIDVFNVPSGVVVYIREAMDV